MEVICLNSNQVLDTLFVACFDEDAAIAAEAKHLSKFFIEYKCTNFSEKHRINLLPELRPNKIFTQKYGQLDLINRCFDVSEIEKFVNYFLNVFLNDENERLGLSYLLKFSGSVANVQKIFAQFIKESWFLNEAVTYNLLSVIYDRNIMLSLRPTFYDIQKSSKHSDLIYDVTTNLLMLKN